MSGEPKVRRPRSDESRLRSLAKRVIGSAVRAEARVLQLAAAERSVGGQASTRDGPSVQRASRLLVIALAEIGDAVLLTPLLRELRRSRPDARIGLVVTPPVATLFETCPYVDELLPYDPRTAKYLRPLVLPLRAYRFARGHLRERGYDVAILPRWDVDSYFATALALFSGAPRRLGYSETVSPRRQYLNAGFDSLLSDAVRSDGPVHDVERNLEMVRALGGQVESDRLELWCTEDDTEFASRVLAALRARGGGPLVAFGIGASHPKRRWPVERFAELGRLLQRGADARIVVVGGPPDVPLERALLAQIDPAAIGFCGKATLRESTAVLAQCDLFVGNDSGPMHLAAASGIPVVEISGHPRGGDASHNNSPTRFRPWGVASSVQQPSTATPPCRRACEAAEAHCILAITVAQVAESCALLLRERTAPSTSIGASR